MEHENAFASKGVGGTALGLGIGALGAQLLGGGLGNLLGGGNTCAEDHLVNRYEANMAKENMELRTKNQLLESNIYTDQKLASLYERLSARIAGVETSVNQQAVINAQITANLSCMQNAINTLSGLTKIVIPVGSICPAPMEKYNSWTAPTTATAGA